MIPPKTTSWGRTGSLKVIRIVPVFISSSVNSVTRGGIISGVYSETGRALTSVVLSTTSSPAMSLIIALVKTMNVSFTPVATVLSDLRLKESSIESINSMVVP